jgi:hypothetical protein
MQLITTSAAGAKFCREVDLCTQIPRLRYTGFPRASLASIRTTNHLKTLFSYSFLMHFIHTKRSTSYFSDTVAAIASTPSCSRLRSASSQRYELPSFRLKMGERSFSFATPAAWNSLPAALNNQTDTKVFIRNLKTLPLIALLTISFISSFVYALLVTWLCIRRTRNLNLDY